MSATQAEDKRAASTAEIATAPPPPPTAAGRPPTSQLFSVGAKQVQN